jgi:sigma-B regulation protein RsbU (phosphoserine phosphatase)
MLPQVAPEVAGYEMVLTYRPACLVTGDYHDFFPSPVDRMAVFVGDGAGHGPAASLLGTTARAIFQTYPGLHGEPGVTLTAVGRLFHGLIPADLFLTGLYLRMEEEGRVSWASAGHEPPLRLGSADRERAADLEGVGLPLGIDPSEVYPTVRWQLAPRERLLLFTDGLWEVADSSGEAFGRQRLQLELTRLSHLPLTALVRQLVARTVEHCGGEDFEDDFTVVAIERREE